MTHNCPTGTHQTPDYLCYENHGCRCDGCNQSERHRQQHYRDRQRARLAEVRAEQAPLKPAPVLDYVAVPLLDLPWYDDRPAS